MKKHKVLIDFPSASAMNASGFRGCTQDLSRIFLALNQQDCNYSPSLFIYPASFKNADFSISQRPGIENDLMIINKLIGETDATNGALLTILRDNNPFYHLAKKTRYLAFLFKHFRQSHFQLRKIETEMVADYIWRNIFSKAFDLLQFREIIKMDKIYVSNFSWSRTKFADYYGKSGISLDTSKFDIVIFHQPNTIQLPKNTLKIIRFHDAIYLKDPDLVFKDAGKLYLKTLHQCKKDSVFVCGSNTSKQDLLKIIPELENKAYVIPCALSNQYEKTLDFDWLKLILKQRLSHAILNTEEKQAKVRAYIEQESESSFKYILHIGAFEPRKNVVNLVTAWHTLHAKSGLKLILCGYSGYRGDEVSQLIAPYVEAGSIIHIEKVMNDELALLYSHAQAFVFPSLAEGFGLPPLEAMQCECPTVVSNISAHAWVYGDAALYCNPYDIRDMINKIESITTNPDAKARRIALIKKGIVRVKGYSIGNVAKMWHITLDKLANYQ